MGRIMHYLVDLLLKKKKVKKYKKNIYVYEPNNLELFECI